MYLRDYANGYAQCNFLRNYVSFDTSKAPAPDAERHVQMSASAARGRLLVLDDDGLRWLGVVVRRKQDGVLLRADELGNLLDGYVDALELARFVRFSPGGEV